MEDNMANPIVSFFKSPLFTWWNSATFGTRVFTALQGKKVGTDTQGNIYYQNKTGERRWVIYKNGPVEASRVPADWHGWLHHTFDDIPSEETLPTKAWEKEHVPNVTGTMAAYKPAKEMGDRAAEYEAWRP